VMSRIADLYREASRVRRTEGLVRLLQRAFSFLAFCILEHRGYWLYAEPEGSMRHFNEADFLPRIADITERFVSSNQQASEMEAEGLEFRSQVPNARAMLDGGAVGPFFFCRSYYVYREYIEDLAEAVEADFVPGIEGLAFRIVSSNEEADELEAQGFPFRSQVANARRNLEKGATAFCLFVGQELASITWHAPNRDAQRSLGEPPYPVDYEKDEICSGGLWSNPKYRRKGLRSYSRLKRIEFLRDSGVKARRGVIARQNVLAFSGRADFQPSAFAEGRYLRILWWKSWKERPLPDVDAAAGGDRKVP